jgi:hypothetical protein
MLLFNPVADIFCDDDLIVESHLICWSTLFKQLYTSLYLSLQITSDRFQTFKMVNIALVVVGSVISCLALGCICKHKMETRNRNAQPNYLVILREREERLEQFRSHYVGRDRHSPNSVPIQNPAVFCVKIPFPEST